MATANAQTAFGFGSGLDWRPTCFVNPFPSTKVCSVCRLVPPTAAMLPCRHTLCLPCYDGSAGKCNRCPVDKEHFQEEDVVWSTLSKDSLLGRKVRCWNAEQGCDTVGTASLMLEHFSNSCQFHTVTCPTCSNKVPHRSFTEHLESECVPCRPREQPVDDNFANAFLEVREALGKILLVTASLQAKLQSFEDRLCSENNSTAAAQPAAIADAVTDALEDRISLLTTHVEGVSTECRGVKTAVEKLSEENASVQTKLESFENRLDWDRLNATLSSIVSDALSAAIEKSSSVCCGRTVEALAEHRREVISEIRDALARNERTVKERKSQECNRKVPGVKAPTEDEAEAAEQLPIASLRSTSNFLNESVPYEWTIDDWKAFLEKAPVSSEYFSGNDGQPSYHYGYLIVPRLCFDKCRIWLRAYVIKGQFDKFLERPLEKTMRLRLEHHNDRKVQVTLINEFRHTMTRSLYGDDEVHVGCSKSVTVWELEQRGVIENNKLRLRLDFPPYSSV